MATKRKLTVKKKLVSITPFLPNAPLKKGDKGMDVCNLQLALTDVGSGQGLADEIGYFGPVTELAVRHFQEAHKIHIDGRYTELTRSVLREVLKCR